MEYLQVFIRFLLIIVAVDCSCIFEDHHYMSLVLNVTSLEGQTRIVYSGPMCKQWCADNRRCVAASISMTAKELRFICELFEEIPSPLEQYIEENYNTTLYTRKDVVANMTNNCENGGQLMVSVNATYCRCVEGHARFNCSVVPGTSETTTETTTTAPTTTATTTTTVDLTPRITSCSASSIYRSDYGCENVYEGVELASTRGGEWVTAYGQTGVGEWLQINFVMAHDVTSVSLLDRCWRETQTSAWDIQLGSASSERHTKPCGGGARVFDCTAPGNDWATLELTARRRTDRVKIGIVSACVDDTRPRGLRAVLVRGNL